MTEALPFLTSAFPAIPGRIRAEPEDFRVEEIPAYAPSGAGPHVYVHFEKRGMTTPEAVRRIARALSADPRRAGWAGLKDQNAVTSQWASFETKNDSDLGGATIEGVRVIETSRHANKLRTGHLRANRFVLHVRGTPPERLDDVRRSLATLATHGVPNYFGPQRFGASGANIPRARRWLIDGEAPPRDRFERKFLVSALQSLLFND